MDVKFKQLYVAQGALYALDEDGYVWSLKEVWNNSVASLTWVEIPHAKREVEMAKAKGNVIKAPTPEEVRRKNERDFDREVSSLDSRLKEHKGE